MEDAFISENQPDSERFARKREEILNAAMRQIADRGLKGLTLTGTAKAVGLNTTSITYYFRRKELLAAAVMERALDRFTDLLLPQASDPRSYMARVLDQNMDLVLQIRRGSAAPLRCLSDMRALEEPDRSTLLNRYFALIRQVAARFGSMETPEEKGRNIARAQLFCDILHWSRSWLDLYAEADLPRVRARLLDLLENGFAMPGATWAPALIPVDPAEQVASVITSETYLRVATRLINERGYRGASVERIAAELNVSKGSFYHHLSGKDDLVRACFDRSYSRISATQHAAVAQGADDWARVTSAIASLMDVQLRDQMPLLRDTALLALPEELRPDVLRRNDRLARRFAGMMSDGIAAGTIRPVDPNLASQILMGAVNSAVDMAPRVARWPSREAAIRAYAGPLAFGFLD
ncbi:TetR/AcrR family transcriptional regulator [Pseudooceanicola sp. HF7]|uniref:TetR/AcrR family transcriptional regulator n=1 Tax=Pseudooceanicola sp. HF7 TaxID=2721560 RepID=UPI00142F3DCD|nr:TetR/AcrR family transcriptional regulator [Pseudooceanicola sp. HF7]NIZ08430.1 TetR/AcrR family transcriptional regulator [Pseudooceanicola sp. HF7]